ncbi:MAG: hypothetical protein CM1200mP10_12080 [Candidatus Neomarinimicrobiota bacterium]|nr:MAG: hypothetical protein CM1200mP10_12080 [Candidatus Neomarinimicrobiota bacterium]
MDYQLLAAVFLVLFTAIIDSGFKIQAFLALLIASMAAGILGPECPLLNN